MGAVRRVAKIALAGLGAGVVVTAFLGRPLERLRSCGHPQNLWSRVSGITGIRLGATHCCSSLGMLADLRAIEAAQEVYRIERGSCPASFEQLTNAVHLEPFNFAFRFVSDGPRWSVSVPQQGLFAGDYLLTSDYKLH